MSCGQGNPVAGGCACGSGEYNSETNQCDCVKNSIYNEDMKECHCNGGFVNDGMYCVPAPPPPNPNDLGGGLTKDGAWGILGGLAGAAVLSIVVIVFLMRPHNPGQIAPAPPPPPAIMLPFAPALWTGSSNPTVNTPDPTVSRTSTMTSENGGNDNGLPPGYAAGVGFF